MTPIIMIFQPVLAKYRLSLFRKLNERHGILLSYSDKVAGLPESVDPVEVPAKIMKCYQFLNKCYLQLGNNGNNIPDYIKCVVVHGNIRFLNVIYVLLVCKIKRKKIIIWTQLVSPTSSKFGTYIRLKFLSLADGILLYSQNEVERFAKMLPNFSGPVIALNNTLDLTEITNAVEQVKNHECVQTEGNIYSSEFTLRLLFCGRLIKKAEIETLIDALMIINRPDVILTIIGDGPEMFNLKHKVDGYGLNSKIEFIGALYDENELASWFLKSDLFVYPGSIGLSLIHAFAYGLPVVTHDFVDGHNPEISAFKPGVNGVFYRAGDATDLANTIDDIISNQAKLKELSENAKLTVEKEFSYESFLLNFDRVLSEVLNRN